MDFPPVKLISPLQAWDDPAYVPRTPHNLPLPGQRPTYIPGPGGVAPMSPLVTPGDVPSHGPISPSDFANVRDAHRYATLMELTFPVPETSDNLGIFLTQSSGL